MGVDVAATAQSYAKKEKIKKRFQDKQTRKALVAFVASGTHKEVAVKKSTKLNVVSLCAVLTNNSDCIVFTNLYNVYNYTFR